ncbi:Farnesol dehydrogenase [Eumeta japonica]|uniref:Farnesol dehydrogenase n=1 Tax=Eumeta variegata TaxID=151549 RepID=A0A4C1VT29_EUMVA|nr:Farnesol dehydrogenase [Eumeta japonica]
MDRWRGKTAVVTGASAGIGAAIALTLAQNGLKVLGLSRREHLVDELAQRVTGEGALVARRCDVADGAAVADAFRWAEDNLGPVHVLVNNAGQLLHGHMTEAGTDPLSDDDVRSMLDVNVGGVVLCSRRAVASMKRNNVEGHIININSIAGHYIPNFTVMNVYPGTKHAVTAITQGLANELAQFNLKIKTTSISPGLVATEMAEVQRLPELRREADRLPRLQPQDVADAVVYALSTPAHVNVSYPQYIFVKYFNNILPSSVYGSLSRVQLTLGRLLLSIP